MSRKCCDPVFRQAPSGKAWFHSHACPINADAHWYELDRVVAQTKSSAMHAWLKHAPGHRCPGCDYVEAHLDELDDEAVG